MTSPYFTLHGVTPSYEHLRMFGCACYPNLSTTVAHKLAPRPTRCIFLRYSTDHKGYWCLDFTTNNIVISRHVVFDETDFPFFALPRLTNDLDIFLQDDSPGVAPMPAPLSVPRVPPGFPPLATAGDPIVPRTEAGSQTASPGGPTSTLGSLTTRTTTAPPTAPEPYPCRPRAPPSLAASRAVPMTSTTPNVVPSTPPVPRAAPVSTTTATPPVALEPYPRHPQAVQEPPSPPLHQQSPSAKAILVEPPVNPHPMITRAKRGFRPTSLACQPPRRQQCRQCPPLSVPPSSIQNGTVPWKKGLLP
jgi:hypothetical protein